MGLGCRRRRFDCLPMVGVELFDYVVSGLVGDAARLLLVNGLRDPKQTRPYARSKPLRSLHHQPEELSVVSIRKDARRCA